MESAMSIFQRIVLLLKVLVMLSLGTSAAAWAECQDHDQQASNAQGAHSELMIAASESGSSDDDDSTTDDPDSNEDDT
jgi:CHASE3 domain sensor protein